MKKLTFSRDSQGKDLHIKPWKEPSGAYGRPCVASVYYRLGLLSCTSARTGRENKRQDHRTTFVALLVLATTKPKGSISSRPIHAPSRRSETPIRHGGAPKPMMGLLGPPRAVRPVGQGDERRIITDDSPRLKKGIVIQARGQAGSHLGTEAVKAGAPPPIRFNTHVYLHGT